MKSLSPAIIEPTGAPRPYKELIFKFCQERASRWICRLDHQPLFGKGAWAERHRPDMSEQQKSSLVNLLRQCLHHATQSYTGIQHLGHNYFNFALIQYTATLILLVTILCFKKYTLLPQPPRGKTRTNPIAQDNWAIYLWPLRVKGLIVLVSPI